MWERREKKKFWHIWVFPLIFVPLKMTCLVTVIDCNIQVFKNLLKWTIFGIFSELWSIHFTCNVESNFQTQCCQDVEHWSQVATMLQKHLYNISIASTTCAMQRQQILRYCSWFVCTKLSLTSIAENTFEEVISS